MHLDFMRYVVALRADVRTSEKSSGWNDFANDIVRPLELDDCLIQSFAIEE